VMALGDENEWSVAMEYRGEYCAVVSSKQVGARRMADARMSWSALAQFRGEDDQTDVPPSLIDRYTCYRFGLRSGTSVRLPAKR
jgi:hypothetical protein